MVTLGSGTSAASPSDAGMVALGSTTSATTRPGVAGVGSATAAAAALASLLTSAVAAGRRHVPVADRGGGPGRSGDRGRRRRRLLPPRQSRLARLAERRHRHGDTRAPAQRIDGPDLR
jgi:hypothetical protein